MSGRKTKVTIEEIRQEFKSKGAVLLTSEYKSCQQQLQFKCSKCDNVYQIQYRNYLLGRNINLLCKDCMKSVTIQDIKKEFKQRGAELVSTKFETVDVPLYVKCSNCNKIFDITWANYKAGHNKSLLCSDCRSKQKKKTIVIDKVKLELMLEENDGKVLYKKKLDEYEKGLIYIPIYPNEKDLSLIQSMVSLRNGQVKNRIYARKCKIEQIKTGKEFLKENHIQGYRKADVTVGLYYGDILVSVMSFGKPRYNKNYEYELIRLATLHDYEVIGGASKMFNWFINNYKPQSIISYCDVRFCCPDPEKTVYTKLGFKYINKTESNYKYWTTDLTKSYSRMACQKHRLSDFLQNFDLTKTEYQNMHDAGFLRIYDCGNYVYVWKNDK